MRERGPVKDRGFASTASSWTAAKRREKRAHMLCEYMVPSAWNPRRVYLLLINMALQTRIVEKAANIQQPGSLRVTNI